MQPAPVACRPRRSAPAPRRRPGLAALTGAAVGLAVLTKGVAGLVPGGDIAVFALAWDAPRLARHVLDYAIASAVAAAVGGSIYLAHAGMHDTYLAAVAANELGGRFDTVLDHHTGDAWFYAGPLITRVPGKILFVLPAVLLFAPGPARRLAIFALCQRGVMLVVISAAATKLGWYVEPMMPFISIALALAGLAVVRAVANSRWPKARWLVIAVIVGELVNVTAHAVVNRYVHPWIPLTAPRAFDTLIAAAARRDALPLVVVDHGFDNWGGLVNYTPPLRFYALAAARAGIAVVPVTGIAAAAPARFVGSCGPVTMPAVRASGRDLWHGNGCILTAR